MAIFYHCCEQDICQNHLGDHFMLEGQSWPPGLTLSLPYAILCFTMLFLWALGAILANIWTQMPGLNSPPPSLYITFYILYTDIHCTLFLGFEYKSLSVFHWLSLGASGGPHLICKKGELWRRMQSMWILSQTSPCEWITHS